LKESNFAEPIKSPSLTAMSLSLRTVMNHKKQVNEIAAFSVRFYPKGLLFNIRLNVWLDLH
jgi:hypothetical protein